MKFSTKYWIEIHRATLVGKWKWFWLIKCCNGRVKAHSKTIYCKKSYCENDALAFGNEIGLQVRKAF